MIQVSKILKVLCLQIILTRLYFSVTSSESRNFQSKRKDLDDLRFFHGGSNGLLRSYKARKRRIGRSKEVGLAGYDLLG